jgi:hypothetical protein
MKKTLSFQAGDGVLQALSSSDAKLAWLIHSVDDYELELAKDNLFEYG